MSLIKAVSAVRARCIVVVKTSRNTGINSDYASYADVMAVLGPALNEAGVSVGFLPGIVRKEGDVWIQVLEMEVAHEDEKTTVSFETVWPEGNRGVNATQRQGMAHTYGKRYALVDYFHLITGDDDDAVRLGQTAGSGNAAPTPPPNAHWSQFCYVPLFDTGTEETASAWSVMADPEGDGERILGDIAAPALAKLWLRHQDHPGLNAWRAELCGTRALALSITDWSACRRDFASMRLPETFADCIGAQLTSLALALNPQPKGAAQ